MHEIENNHFRYERAVNQIEGVADTLHNLTDDEYTRAMEILIQLIEEERVLRYGKETSY